MRWDQAFQMSKNQMAIRTPGPDEHGFEFWWRVDRHGFGKMHCLGKFSIPFAAADRDAHEDWEPEVPFDVVTQLAKLAGK